MSDIITFDDIITADGRDNWESTDAPTDVKNACGYAQIAHFAQKIPALLK